jgi:RimJ/RimL family protein N-acetyltransferase
MAENSEITVREINLGDIDLIADYWLNSDPQFLINMGVDLAKLPGREALTNMLSEQINLPLHEKKSYALIWELNGRPVGHSNVNAISFGDHATMHLHIWQSNIRKQGLGSQLVKMSLPFYFEKLELQTLICEPYALNPAPNKTLKKVGFTFEKRYRTIPGTLNFEQEVNRWTLTRQTYKQLSFLPQG